jgi:hypothetical protein
MKLRVNFIFSAEAVRKIILYAMWAGFFMMLFLIFFLIVDGKRMKNIIPETKAKITSIDAEYAGLPRVAAPGEAQMAGIISKVSAINRMKIGRSEGASNILSALEELCPGSMSFISFQYSLEDRTIVIEAIAGSPEIMQHFTANMEKSRLFKNVFLEKQSQKVSASGIQAIDFILKAEENLR